MRCGNLGGGFRLSVSRGHSNVILQVLWLVGACERKSEIKGEKEVAFNQFGDDGRTVRSKEHFP